MRVEAGTFVARDTTLLREQSGVELPAVGVLMTPLATVGMTTRVALLEVGVTAPVAVGARRFVMGGAERESGQRVMLLRQQHRVVPETRVLLDVAGGADSCRGPAHLSGDCRDELRIVR